MCPDREILSAYFDGEIEAPWNKAIAAHLASCAGCRGALEKLARTRDFLQADPVSDWKDSMERVRMDLGERVHRSLPSISVWRRRVALPVPVAALVAALLLFLGVSLAVTLLRSNFGMVRITKAPAGGTEIQIAAPISDLENLLKTIGGEDPSREDVITLPKHVRLLPVGEPRMGKEAEFLRKKPW
jgi:predicted anti-sigma-YlaC factor YlaD